MTRLRNLTVSQEFLSGFSVVSVSEKGETILRYLLFGKGKRLDLFGWGASSFSDSSLPDFLYPDLVGIGRFYKYSDPSRKVRFSCH